MDFGLNAKDFTKHKKVPVLDMKMNRSAYQVFTVFIRRVRFAQAAGWRKCL